MKLKIYFLVIVLILTSSSCSTASSDPTPASASTSPQPASTSTSLPAIESFTPTLAFTSTPTLLPSPTQTPAPTNTPTGTPPPTIESLKAQVLADKLSCRYGPGAEYLYLYALNKTANIKLIGRTDANNWVWVDGTHKCWVNAKFITVDGDPKSLPVVYPGTAKLPISPYYPGPSWANATRDGNQVKVDWEPVPISPGKYESPTMHQYLLEVWRCENGQIIFETLGTNLPYITVATDEAGCAAPSHGRVFVQEKHGYGGPIEVPWPAP